MERYQDDFRCICADLRNANPGQSSGPLDIDRPWDAYTDDQLGLMDHLGIREFMVMGFCIGAPNKVVKHRSADAAAHDHELPNAEMVHQPELVVGVGVPGAVDLEGAAGLAGVRVAQVSADAA